MSPPKAEHNNESSLLVSWKEPDEVEGFEIVSYDIVAVDYSNKMEQIMTNTKSANPHFVFPGLKSGHFYRFKVKPLRNRI